MFDQRSHHRITIDPAAANDQAIRSYTKVGFRPVGVMRQYERSGDGQFHDGLLMDLLRGELAELRARRQTLQSQYASYVRDQARFDHVRLWSSADVDWIGHARWISETMPDTRQAQLDQFGAALHPKLTFVSSDGSYDTKDWQVSSGASFTIAGHVKRRDIADDIRRKLVSFYDQVETKGPDVPDRFAMDFSTKVASPGVAAKLPPDRIGGDR